MDNKTQWKKIVAANKITDLPKYIFTELDEWKIEARKKWNKLGGLIDLGIGNPDGPTSQEVIDAAIESTKDKVNHGYPSFCGKPNLREAITSWMKRRYDVDITDEFDIQILNGAKEGLANIAFAFTNPGDINIIPDPYYPVLSRGTLISGGTPYYVSLKEENDFLPDLDTIPEEIAKKAKIFIINYPNNPTAATAPRWFLEKLVAFCKKYGILLVSDLAYGEIAFGDYRPLSIFNIDGAFDVAVEFHSCSKTFNMAGWRVGYVIGNKYLIDIIHSMKMNMDYGTSMMVQDAAAKAFTMDYASVKETVDNYARRRIYVRQELINLGWDIKPTKATMYFWPKIPKGYTSESFCRMVLDKTGVVFTPGFAFGELSDGHFRLSVVQPDEKIKEAFDRLKEAGIRYN